MKASGPPSWNHPAPHYARYQWNRHWRPWHARLVRVAHHLVDLAVAPNHVMGGDFRCRILKPRDRPLRASAGRVMHDDPSDSFAVPARKIRAGDELRDGGLWRLLGGSVRRIHIGML